MTLVVKVDGVALPDGALVIDGGTNSNLPGGVQGLPLAAYYGESLTGNYSIDDPEGAYDFTSLHTITAEETAATNPFITGGWITGRSVHRGIYKSGVSRVWNVDFIDINWNYSLMVFRASSAKRPYETDIARAAFIQASAPMAYTPSYDNGRFNVTDNPVNFDESDLVGRYPIEAFNEFVGIAGKNFYNYWDPTDEEISIHYDLIGVGPTAALTISNDIADTSSTCFYPFLDAELSMDSAYKVTGMLFAYRGAYAYGIRQATIDELGPSIFSPDGLQRDEVYRTDRVGRLATAQALIQSMLTQRAEDTDTIKVSIRVPAAQVNDALPGDVITVKFTHLPGYETDTDLPIIRRNVVPSPGRVDTYDLHLELSGAGKATGPGGGDPTPFPQEPVECNPEIIQTATGSSLGTNVSAVFADTPTPGNVIVAMMVIRSTSAMVTPTGFTQIESQIDDDDGQSMAMYYREVQPGDTTTVHSGGGNPSANMRMYIAEVTGVGVTLTDSVLVSDDSAHGPDWTQDLGSVTVTEGGIVFGGAIIGNNAADDTFVDGTNGAITLLGTGGGVNQGGPAKWFGYYLPTADGSVEISIDWNDPGSDPVAQGQAAISAFFECGTAATTTCPGAGTPNHRPEVVTLTGADGTTRCPFADGTLRVFIDATEQTDGLVSQDGATGDFTLGFDPTPTEVCTVEYLGR